MITKSFAPAKINLTLHVTGQRKDGYHLLDSLVIFASVGDTLSFFPNSKKLELIISGPEAKYVPRGEDNLVLRAASLAGLTSGSFFLQKNLPLAAGIGGGSSNAAAALRLIRYTPNDNGQSLGADVPICINRQSARMRGIGDIIDPIFNLTKIFAVLVNPRCFMPTQVVFEKLQRKSNPAMTDIPVTLDYRELIKWLSLQRNDLEIPAQEIEPVIKTVFRTLRRANADLIRMSGSGSTCFGLFSNYESAQAAAQEITDNHPSWWVQPATLG
ncbi:MAG: 4-(cytidine 5'-diphospho)-2-C-methyl-D-erythritol kinase [Aestuariivita sp.]|nr:4-(cytidine 5'-diphospho)-2-C-methyl-D-erythritol kinase [Aestuariivita sp.]